METLNPIHQQPRHLSPLLNYTAENYTAPQYEVIRSIFRAHGQPRFGYNNDFGDLLSDNSEQQKDYVLGVIIGAIIILSVAVIWLVLILSLRIAGQDRVGFLAGRLVKYTEENGGVEVEINDEEDDLIDEAHVVEQTTEKREVLFKRKVTAVRLMFVISGMIVIASGCIFYGKGVVSFRRSFSEVRKGINLVQSTAKLGIVYSETIMKEKEEVNQGMLETQAEAGICGYDGVVSNKIQEVFTDLSEAYTELSSMIDGSLADMSDDLRGLVELTERLESSLYSADVFFYIMIAVTCFLAFLIVAMLIGVWFSAKNVSNFFTKCTARAIIWPLFIFFLVVSWIFSTLFLVIQLGGADFCMSPDKYVAQFLKNNRDMFDGLVLGFVIYYVSGCTITAPGTEALFKIASQISVVAEISHNLLEQLDEKSAQDIIDICGLTERRAEALINIASTLHAGIHVLDKSLVGLREILACSTFNQIYVTMVHNAVCVESVNGLTYIFSTTMVISVFSMVMIMFRAALYPVQEAPILTPLSKCDSIEFDPTGIGVATDKSE